MLSTIIALFTVGIVLSFYYQNYILLGIFLITGVLLFLFIQFVKKTKKEKFKKAIVEKAEKHFININKEPWEILEEIPHISRIEAKKAVFIRHRFGNYQSAEDFIYKMNIKEEQKQDVLDVIFV